MAYSAITFSPGEVSAYYAFRVPHLQQKCAAEWRGPCPVHSGTDDNFAVKSATGQAFCHSLCGQGWDIIALEMELSGNDFKTAKTEIFRIAGRVEPEYRRNTGSTNENSAGKWRELARYPYVDRDGNLLSEVVRFLKPDGAKTFVQERPSGAKAAGTTDPARTVATGGIVIGLGAGKYVIDTKVSRAKGKTTWIRAKDDKEDYQGAEYCFRECPRVPYRLPELLNSTTVYLPEGEKDVHTLEAWGLTASCNSGGSANSALYAGWTDYFRGRHVVILVDNDAPGRKHAAAVATAVLSVAASVRIVELPNLPENGDVTDWKDAGGTFEQFQELTKAAMPLNEAALSALRARWGLADEEPQSARAEASGDWPQPEPLQSELPPVQPFSADLLPDSLRPLVEDVAERLQVPLDFPGAATGLGLAGVVNRRALIQPKANDSEWVVTPNLWGGIVAPPGFLKSPVIHAATRPLNRIQAEWRREYEAALKDYELAKEEYGLQCDIWKKQYKDAMKIKKAAPKRPECEPEKPKLRRLIVNDATFEALHQTMSENPAGVLVIRDELTGWWSQLDRPGREGERAFCLEAWNGDSSFTIDRIGRGTIHVPHCCMSMLGGIQPGRLRSYLVDALADGPSNDGLIQRFQVLVWPDTSPYWEFVDRAPDAAAEKKATIIFDRLAKLDPEHPALFRFAPDAQELLIDFLRELESKIRGDELHPALISHLSKYRSLMPSLALLFELADRASCVGFEDTSLSVGQNFVSLKNTQRAAAFCDYLESHARRVYSCIVTPQQRAARDLADHLKRKHIRNKDGGFDWFVARDVYLKGWTGLDSPEAVAAAARVLEDAGWLRNLPFEPGPLGGRPSNRYAVNPGVWK